MSSPSGAGPGAITSDGSAVEVYARLPAGPNPALLHRHMPAGAAVLDLGAGTGRLADPLVEFGHRVVAVDSSPDMLAHVRRADAVLSRIQDLYLPDRFDVVLLASHLINTPQAEDRRDLFQAIARHLRPAGQAFIEWHPPAWFDGLETAQTYTGTIGDLRSSFYVHTLTEDLLTGTVTYRTHVASQPASQPGPEQWTHEFTARRLSQDELRSEANQASLDLTGPLQEADRWLQVLPAPTGPAPGRLTN